MSITLKNVSFTYAQGTPFETAAIENVSLEIADGEFVGIMGRTGCGKSTLIQLIDGLLTPKEGTVLLDGKDINAPDYNRDILRKAVGVVFQFPEYQLFETTVRKDVAFGMKHHGLNADEVEKRVKGALELMGFDYEEVKDLSPMTFSGGEKRRIAIAGILAGHPKILILDEPIAGLDPKGREKFLSLLDELNAKGITIIMISHNADALSEHAKRIILLKKGRIIADDTVSRVLSDDALINDGNIGKGQIKELVDMLKEKGVNIPDDIVRYRDFIEYIKAKAGGKIL